MPCVTTRSTNTHTQDYQLHAKAIQVQRGTEHDVVEVCTTAAKLVSELHTYIYRAVQQKNVVLVKTVVVELSYY